MKHHHYVIFNLSNKGQEKFHALGPIYYRSSNGALLVYDICDEQSFQKIKIWIKELKKVLGQDISIIIVGNKIDMERERVVPLGNDYDNNIVII